MNTCPVCNGPLIPGGIITTDASPYWVPEKELYRKRLRLGVYHPLKVSSPDWLRRGRIEKAYYCEQCRKIIGVFDAGG